jgi:hypothetical protein
MVEIRCLNEEGKSSKENVGVIEEPLGKTCSGTTVGSQKLMLFSIHPRPKVVGSFQFRIFYII